MTKGVVGRHEDDKGNVSFGNAPPEEKKPAGHICKHCEKDYKMKMHLVRHEKGCNKKE
jgi:hypothetical protein